jgi:ADP-ribose pyrophosphatase YjhB (NUDIX family)
VSSAGPPPGVSEGEVAQLVELLGKLRAGSMCVPDLPPPVWRALAGIAPVLAVEVLVTRSGREVLMTYRDDDDWTGWHVPGGFVGCGEAVETACGRIARRELGVDVRTERILGAFTWPDHPYAHAVSLLCVCTAPGTPAAGEFFSSVPEPVVAHHAEFVARFFAAGWTPGAA